MRGAAMAGNPAGGHRKAWQRTVRLFAYAPPYLLSGGIVAGPVEANNGKSFSLRVNFDAGEIPTHLGSNDSSR
jgi:hypothetical protein